MPRWHCLQRSVAASGRWCDGQCGGRIAWTALGVATIVITVVLVGTPAGGYAGADSSSSWFVLVFLYVSGPVKGSHLRQALGCSGRHTVWLVLLARVD
jgi:hypothetical protein